MAWLAPIYCCLYVHFHSKQKRSLAGWDMSANPGTSIDLLQTFIISDRVS